MMPNTASAFLAPTATTTIQAHGILGWIAFVMLLSVGVGVIYWYVSTDSRRSRKSSHKGSSSARRPTRVSVSRSLRREIEKGAIPIGKPPLPPVMVSGDNFGTGLPSGRKSSTYSERKRSVAKAERVAEATDALLEKRIGSDYSSTASNWDTQSDVSVKAVVGERVDKVPQRHELSGTSLSCQLLIRAGSDVSTAVA
ncbi:hypothetical protein FOL47_001392, partial [Perkinsus chesapeaki]